MNFNEQVMQIVSDPIFDNFTPFELKKAVEGINGEDYLETIGVTKLICAQIKLLVGAGIIKRSTKEHFSGCIYVKTHQNKSHINALIESPSVVLKAKYGNYKKQLLSGLGEAEEYKQLCREYPELQEEIQPKYNNIRDQNTKILGKIKAIESLLNNKST